MREVQQPPLTLIHYPTIYWHSLILNWPLINGLLTKS